MQLLTCVSVHQSCLICVSECGCWRFGPPSTCQASTWWLLLKIDVGPCLLAYACIIVILLTVEHSMVSCRTSLRGVRVSMFPVLGSRPPGLRSLAELSGLFDTARTADRTERTRTRDPDRLQTRGAALGPRNARAMPLLLICLTRLPGLRLAPRSVVAPTTTRAPLRVQSSCSVASGSHLIPALGGAPTLDAVQRHSCSKWYAVFGRLHVAHCSVCSSHWLRRRR